MKRTLALVLAFVMIISLPACGKSKEEEQKRIEEERILNLVTNESWFGIYEGDEYKFNTDRTGSHNGVTLEYQISDGIISVTEGAAGTTKNALAIDESGSTVKLVINDNENYYVSKDAYTQISEGIRAEYTAELIGHEAWAVRKGSAFVMYFMFYQGGGGFAVTTAGTYGLEWEFADNNTLKITVTTNQKQSANYDIVVENGSYKLVQANNSAITATPHN